MAGHASNWFKTGSGSAKGKVFISNAAIKGFYGMTSDKEVQDYKKYLHSIEDKSWAPETLLKIAEESVQPGGQAKAAPKANTAAEKELTSLANQVFDGPGYENAKVVHDPKNDTYMVVKEDGSPGTSPVSYKNIKYVLEKTLEAKQAKAEQAKTPEPGAVTKGFAMVTQANGKQKEKPASIQGDLAVVETPYGHAVIHKASGKALLYVDGDKQQVYSTYKKKYVTQSAPSEGSETMALSAMDALNKSSSSWNRGEVEALSPGAQEALKNWAQNKGIKATDIAFAPQKDKAGGDMPAATPKVVSPDPVSSGAFTTALGMDVTKTGDGKYQIVGQDGKAIGKPYLTESGAINRVKKLGSQKFTEEVSRFQDRIRNGEFKSNYEAMPKAFSTIANFWRVSQSEKAAPQSSENDSMHSYQGGGYTIINQFLWGSSVGSGNTLKLNSSAIPDYAVKETAKKITDLMAVSKRQSAPFAFTSYRAVNADHPLTKWAYQASVGDAYLNKGFDSSSFNPLMTPINGGPTAARLIFDVPKDAKGLMFSGTPGYTDNLGYELEWLAPANGRWAVKEVRDVGGVREVVVSLLEQRDLNGNVIWP
jgi:hypothetical protein